MTIGGGLAAKYACSSHDTRESLRAQPASMAREFSVQQECTDSLQVVRPMIAPMLGYPKTPTIVEKALHGSLEFMEAA